MKRKKQYKKELRGQIAKEFLSGVLTALLHPL
jgi:hypothetical protein